MQLQNKEYRVISVKSHFNDKIYTYDHILNKYIIPDSQEEYLFFNSMPYTYSLERLSDNCVFTVGEKIHLCSNGCFPITRIEKTKNDRIVIHFEREGIHFNHNTILLENAVSVLRLAKRNETKLINIESTRDIILEEETYLTKDEKCVTKHCVVWSIVEKEDKKILTQIPVKNILEKGFDLTNYYFYKKAAIESMKDYSILFMIRGKENPVIADKTIINDRNYRILSVKRLSDNQIFNLMLRPDTVFNENPIRKFTYSGEYKEDILIHFRDNSSCLLSEYKCNKKDHYILDSNGYKIYLGNIYWFINSKMITNHIMSATYWHGMSFDDNYLRFSTEKAAQKYVNNYFNKEKNSIITINKSIIESLEKLVTGPHMRAMALIKILKEKLENE